MTFRSCVLVPISLFVSCSLIGRFLGGIDHRHFIRLDDIDMKAIGKVTARVATGGAGGLTELRKGNFDAPILATGKIRDNEAGEGFWEETVDFTSTEGEGSNQFRSN